MHILVPYYFIASQGPKDNTIDDFWTMCFEYNVTRILMLCTEFEGDKKKCSNYWDENMKSDLFENIGNTNSKKDNNLEEKIIRVEKKENFLIYNLKIGLIIQLQIFKIMFNYSSIYLISLIKEMKIKTPKTILF